MYINYRFSYDIVVHYLAAGFDSRCMWALRMRAVAIVEYPLSPTRHALTHAWLNTTPLPHPARCARTSQLPDRRHGIRIAAQGGGDP